LLVAVALTGAKLDAQTIGYRQTNLASNLPGVANKLTPGLANPWGIAFLSDQPFFIADNKVGRITVRDATGLGVAIGGCGGNGSGMQPNRDSVSMVVTAQSGAISHTATISVTVQ
jgi:hypothetical protein